MKKFSLEVSLPWDNSCANCVVLDEDFSMCLANGRTVDGDLNPETNEVYRPDWYPLEEKEGKN